MQRYLVRVRTSTKAIWSLSVSCSFAPAEQESIHWQLLQQIAQNSSSSISKSHCNSSNSNDTPLTTTRDHTELIPHNHLIMMLLLCSASISSIGSFIKIYLISAQSVTEDISLNKP
uniref:Uncharacterized protein n=1 Tax=Graphocephala atropunctata TaxID=36148 RepID=A0A1B6LI04_9HEMI